MAIEKLMESYLSRLDDKILTESFSAQNMSKVLDLIGRYLTKTFGVKASWANEGELISSSISGQKFYFVSFYFANGAEFRIGFKGISGGSFSISRIDYWKPGFTKVKMNSQNVAICDLSVTFDHDLSVMQIFPKVLPAIKNLLITGKARTIDILISGKTPALVEGEKTYTGNKSEIVRNMLRDGKTKDDIYAQIGNDASAKSLISKIGKELGVVVTAKVLPAGNKGETASPAKNASIKKGYKLVPKYSDISTVYEDLDRLLDATVIKRKFNSLLVTGAPGTAKTQSIMNFLKGHGIKSAENVSEGEADLLLIKGGSVSAWATYANLFEYRESGKLLLCDDADAMFDDATKNNLLKAALDSYDERYISWETKNPNIFKVNGKQIIKEGSPEWEENIADGKFPNRFKYSGQIIIISNKHITEFDSAIRSRCISIDITIKSQDILNRIETLIDQGSKFAGADKATMEKALKFMKGLPGLSKRSGEYWPGTTYSKEDYIAVKEDEMEINFRTYMTVVKFANLPFPDNVWQRLAVKYAGIPEKLLNNAQEEQKE